MTLFSSQDATDSSGAEPLAVLHEQDEDLPLEVRIWRKAPWPLDARDEQLMGLATSQGQGVLPY